MMLSNIGNQLTSAMASAGRVMAFLCRPEHVQYVQRPPASAGPELAIELVDASFGWSPLPAPAPPPIDASSVALSLVHDTADSALPALIASIASGPEKGKGSYVAVERKGLGLKGKGSYVAVEIDGVEAKGEGEDEAPAGLDNARKEAERESVDVAGVQEVEAAGLDRAVHTISNLSVAIEKGSLVGVVGPIGSGKSSLLSGLLDELCLHSGAPFIALIFLFPNSVRSLHFFAPFFVLPSGCPAPQGSVTMRGSVAYHQQNAWIYNATIKDNILFSQAYDEDRFRAVASASSLDADVAALKVREFVTSDSRVYILYPKYLSDVSGGGEGGQYRGHKIFILDF